MKQIKKSCEKWTPQLMHLAFLWVTLHSNWYINHETAIANSRSTTFQAKKPKRKTIVPGKKQTTCWSAQHQVNTFQWMGCTGAASHNQNQWHTYQKSRVPYLRLKSKANIFCNCLRIAKYEMQVWFKQIHQEDRLLYWNLYVIYEIT